MSKKKHELPLSVHWVELPEAIQHALWESWFCFQHEAFCASLAMLRKALDLWSQHQRDQLALTFDKKKREKDDVYWRLIKIAEVNPIYKDSIHYIVDQLRLAGNDVMHDPTRCPGCPTGMANFYDRPHLQMAFQDIHGRVEKLITTTMPEVGDSSSHGSIDYSKQP